MTESDTGNAPDMTGKSVTVSDTCQADVRQSDLLTIAEAAARLGKSERTIRRMVASGKLNTIDINGRVCVQFAGTDTHGQMTGKSVTAPADVRTNVRPVSHPEADALRDTIRRQDSEIAYLRGELTAARETVQALTRMLPAPKGNARPPGTLPAWALGLIVAAIMAAGGYLLWLMK